ncbi:HAD-IC family P-type ATPase [Candidatus Dependentiae bacterium]|nr:HAD-IC family P-type ATPase [Candidatus Dependentiae bacterium]
MQMKFYKENIETITSKLKTSLKTGLTQDEAKKRLKKIGPNILPQKKPINPLLILARQFLNPLMFVLLIAIMFSLIIGEIKDAIVIAIAVILNIVIGFIQEWKAERAVEKLKSYEVLHCKVIRNEKTKEIEAKKLVPGDIIILEAGSKIPADIRLFDTNQFEVDEAILTGESKPVKKQSKAIENDATVGDRINMAFSGTSVINGKATGIVVKTGSKTQLGHIAGLITETEEKSTPLQEQIKKLSWILGIIFIFIVIIILLIGIIRGIQLTKIIIMGIALAVASIPEGLLVAVTVVLAVGTQRMLKRKALVRHLIAAETLGSVSVICTDKTGTITKGQMQVDTITTLEDEFKINEIKNKKNFIDKHENFKKILIAAILNNDAEFDPEKNKGLGDPTEIALLQAADNFGLNPEEIKQKYELLEEIPFSSELKYMATSHKFNDQEKLIIKGAPETVLNMCKKNDYLKKIREISNKLAKEGLRLLVIASKDSNQINLQEDIQGVNFLGLIGIKDPLRPKAKETVEELKKAGIKLVLVTGDHKDTAANIAKSAGMSVENGIMTGSELEEISEEELTEKIQSIDIFARVEPKHKIKIIKAWQANNQSVAMIGDGVNDAPALKAANIGVSLGSGSDVTHEISDIILLNDNLKTIKLAVKEGRTIFDNIRKVITYLLSDSFGELILISLTIIFNYPLPILATQILWINLISDGFPDIALTMEPSEPEIMREPPREKNEPLMNKEIKTIIFGVTIITDIILFLFYIFLLKTSLNYNHIRTIIFTTLAINSLFYAFSMKSLRKSIFKINLLSNHWLIAAVFVSFFAHLLILYIPFLQSLFETVSLNLFDWILVISLSMTKTIAIEITKRFFIKD